jgi:O-antigen ligase
VLAGLLVIPVLLVVFAGRMTSISASDGTGQSRIQLWSESLGYFQQSPLFGIGMDNYQSYSSHVAHNSFIHSYTELGLFGGTLFVSAFYLALHGLYHVKAKQEPDLDPELRRLHPYLFALVFAYAVGISFLSRTYVVPTFLILGVATVYLRLHSRETRIELPDWRRLILPRLAGVSFTFLFMSYTFVRLLVNWK